MKRLLLIGAALVGCLAGGIPEAHATSCAYPMDYLCAFEVTTILDASSVAYAENEDDLEIQVLEVFGADLGVEAGEAIVLPNRPEVGGGGRMLVYVSNGEVVHSVDIDEETGTVECGPCTEPVDIDRAIELGFQEDCSETVREELTPDNYCDTGFCEATVGDRNQGLPTLLGVFTLALFARRRVSAMGVCHVDDRPRAD